MREKIFAYVKEKYDTEPEYLWRSFPGYAVLRRADNRKWYAMVADIDKEKIGQKGKGRTDIMNVKTDDPLLYDMLIRKDGIVPGYHMGKGSWISVILDGRIAFDEICAMIDMSYHTVMSGKRNLPRPPKDWIIPANPKYFDIIHAFDKEKEIVWKQGSGIRKGDTVFMYVASPVSAIMYRCKVTMTDIPYNGKNEAVNIPSLMKIRLEKRYDEEEFSFKRLKDEFGIFAVRGPRGVPHSLRAALDR